MIISTADKIFAVIVPQKCGISSVTNILTFEYIDQPMSKNKCRSLLKKHKKLINVEQVNDLEIIKNMPTRPDFVFAVVRDPINRIISAYNDRVVKKNKDNLVDTSWKYFFKNFRQLVEDKTDVGVHCRLQTDYLGYNANFYDKFFWTDKINIEFKPIVESLINKTIPDVVENSSNQNQIKLGKHEVNFFKEYYSDDYALIEQAKNNKLLQLREKL